LHIEINTQNSNILWGYFSRIGKKEKIWRSSDNRKKENGKTAKKKSRNFLHIPARKIAIFEGRIIEKIGCFFLPNHGAIVIDSPL